MQEKFASLVQPKFVGSNQVGATINARTCEGSGVIPEADDILLRFCQTRNEGVLGPEAGNIENGGLVLNEPPELKETRIGRRGDDGTCNDDRRV